MQEPFLKLTEAHFGGEHALCRPFAYAASCQRSLYLPEGVSVLFLPHMVGSESAERLNDLPKVALLGSKRTQI